ncbi:MAG: DoxX family protein [Chloroflexota bacterium]
MLRDLARLIVRLVTGGLLAGHGGQKLFGWFGGYGVEGTSGWLHSLGMRPSRPWAYMAGGSEFVGGLLTMLGFLHPIGPITTLGPMSMAMRKAHWNKPIWVTEGGGELPVTNIAVAAALALTGPGRLSLDHQLGLRLPSWVGMLALMGVAGGVIYGTYSSESVAAPSPGGTSEVEVGTMPPEAEDATMVAD